MLVSSAENDEPVMRTVSIKSSMAYWRFGRATEVSRFGDLASVVAGRDLEAQPASIKSDAAIKASDFMMW